MLANKKVLSALKTALNIGMVAEHAEAISIVETIQPVVQVDDIKLTGKVIVGDVPLNLDVAGGVQVDGYTCPAGRRAYILMLGKQTTTGNTQAMITIGGAATKLEKLSTIEGYLWFGLEAWLEAGDAAGLLSTDDITDTARSFYFIFVEVPW